MELNLYLDFIGAIVSIGILWGLVPESSINFFIKICLTIFFIIDHMGLLPAIGLFLKPIEEVNKEDNNND